jgi:hypothetical protein
VRALVRVTNARIDAWGQKLERIAHAYRTTENITTGFTPFSRYMVESVTKLIRS